MYCSRKLFKGNSYEICLPLVDSGVTMVRFYTTGSVIVEKEPEIVEDSMCFSFTEEELAVLPDGVLRMELVTEYETIDTNTPYVIVTPVDYSGTTLDEMLDDAYQSGYTEGQEDCTGGTCEWAYESGYTSGYESGSTDGYDSGYTDGQAACDCTDAYNSGYTDGMDTGKIIGYNSGFTEGIKDYFCVSNIDVVDGEIYINIPDWGSSVEIELSRDKRNWTPYTFTTGITAVQIPALGKLYFNGYNHEFLSNKMKITSSASGAKFKISGDLRTLNYHHYPLRGEEFSEFFEGFGGLRHADELIIPAPAGDRQYYCMFKDCVNLLTPPVMTATTLTGNFCYEGMFSGCTSLEMTPVLPATALTQGCYRFMFSECHSLTGVTSLPATTLPAMCYHSMFVNCQSLETAPALPATSLSPQCYMNMFSGCENLVSAPELNALTLDDYSYRMMFFGCSSLDTVKCLATDISATDATYKWLEGASQTGTFIKNPNMNYWSSGESGIPTGWTVQDAN